MRTYVGILSFLAGVLLCTAASSGAVIIYTGQTVDLGGAGFGNVPPVLTVQAHGNDTTEWGAVGWDGLADVYPTDPNQTVEGPPKTQTRTVSELLSEGITKDTFGVVFNINEDGEETVTIETFSVDFYLADGTLSFSAAYTAPAGGLVLAPVGQGQGQAGHIFRSFLMARNSRRSLARETTMWA